MDLIMIPGFWLDGASWDEVAQPLRDAGHTVHAVTLPGLESRAADRSNIGLRDHVDAVIALVDSLEGQVILVGHSGGSAIAHAAADARVERIARVIHVDDVPLGPGECINDKLPEVNGEVPLPDWSAFDDDDLAGLDDDLRARFRAMAIPQPVGVARDKQQLSNEDRFNVPATVIACEFTEKQLHEWLAGGDPGLAEFEAMRNLEVVELPTGHWPQFTRPNDLARVLLNAVDRRR